MTDHRALRAYVFVLVTYLAVCGNNFKTDCQHILLLFCLKSGACLMLLLSHRKPIRSLHVTVKSKLKANSVYSLANRRLSALRCASQRSVLMMLHGLAFGSMFYLHD